MCAAIHKRIRRFIIVKYSKYATGPVQCGSIHEIYRRLQKEGYRIGESALRAWVKNGQIPAVYRGKMALVLYEDVLTFITNGYKPIPPAA